MRRCSDERRQTTYRTCVTSRELYRLLSSASIFRQPLIGGRAIARSQKAGCVAATAARTRRLKFPARTLRAIAQRGGWPK